MALKELQKALSDAMVALQTAIEQLDQITLSRDGTKTDPIGRPRPAPFTQSDNSDLRRIRIFSKETVIGDDDRVQIENTRQFPWHSICLLRIRMPNGELFTGTGFLVGMRTVITAGHCVYSAADGGWAERIEVAAGANGGERPFGSTIVSRANLRTVGRWIDREAIGSDYGAIILSDDAPFGDQLDFFHCTTVTDDLLDSVRLTISGYPVDVRPRFTQWAHSEFVQGINASTLDYMIDTEGGHSGAPLWYMQEGQRYVVGIHTNGSDFGNRATRITQSVLEDIEYWIAEGG